MSVNEALRIVRGRWRIVVVCLLLALAAAGVATYLTPREYSSNVTLYVALQGRADSSEAAYQASQIAKGRVTSYAPLLTDERVTQPVIDKLALGVTPAQLAQRITVTVKPDTVVLTAAVTETSPEGAANIANGLAEEFVGLVGQLEQPFGPTPTATPGQPAPEPTKIGVTIIRPAVADPVPVAPNVPVNLAVGAALGLLVGIAAAFVSNARDTRVRSSDRLRALTGSPVLAEIPGDRDARLHPLTLGAASGSARVEAFRKLRTNLQFPEGGRPHRAVVVTSPSVGDGKSTTASNLALALADSGCRVLLVDLNLRRPDVDRYLQMEPGAGAANVLAGRIAFHRAVMRWVEGGLDVLPAGPVPVNPSELLTSRAMGALLDEVRAKYDFVILDTPAILPVTDAAAVAARADGAVLVVRYGRTSEEEVSSAVSGLEAVGAKLLGVAVAGNPNPRRWLRRRALESYPEPHAPSPQPRPASPLRTDVDPPTIQVPIVKLAGHDGAPGNGAGTNGAAKPAANGASTATSSGGSTNGADTAGADDAERANGGAARPSPSPRP